MGKDRPVLLTGANGQLGRALRERSPDAHHADRARLDLTSQASVKALMAEIEPGVVINTAAYTAVDQAEQEPEVAHAVNADGVRNLVQSLPAGARLVHLSTDYVFDGTQTEPYRETDPTAPRSVYGRTKLAGEDEARSAPSHLIVRTSGVFGDGKNFVRTIVELGATRPELTVVDDLIGRPTYAVDLAKGIMDLLGKGATGTFHLTGSGPHASWADVAELALKLAGSSAVVKRVSTKEYYASKSVPIAERPQNSVLDNDKAAAIGVELPDWRDALERYIAKELA